MKKDPVGEFIKELVTEHPDVLVKLLPEDVAAQAKAADSIRHVELDVDALSGEHPAPLYQRNDPLVRLIQEHPEVVLKLLRDESHMDLPAYTSVLVEEQDLYHLTPQAPTHTVLLCQKRGATVAGIAVEILHTIAPDRPRHWPLNATTLHYRLQKTTALVVIATNPEVAAWAARPIYWQGPERPPFVPLVIGPERSTRGLATASPADPARRAFAALLGRRSAAG